MSVDIDFMKVSTATPGTASSTVTLQLRGFGSSANDTTAETIDGAEFLQAIGFATRPVIADGLEAICVRRGDEVIAFVVLNRAQKNAAGSYALKDLAQGETRMYGAAAPDGNIKIDPNGNIIETPASGQVVSLGDVPANTKFVIGDGEALHSFCVSLQQQFNQLRTDYQALAGTAGPYPLVFNPANWPGSSTSVGSPPANSTKVKAI